MVHFDRVWTVHCTQLNCTVQFPTDPKLMINRTLLTSFFTLALLQAEAQCVTGFPMNEPFTSFTVGTPGTLVNNWSNLTTDDLDWWVDNNGTPTANTGPIGDRTSSNTGGKYLYTSAALAAATPNKAAIVQSPCFNLTGLATPYLTFWYHLHGAQQGSLVVDLNVNGTVIQNLWSITGDQGLRWKQGWLDLTPYANQNNLRIRFRSVTGSGTLSDIGLDDVFVGNLAAVLGCNEPTASNYSASVNINNGSCSYSCPAGQKRVRIDIVSDNYPQESSWTLKNGTNGVVLASGNNQNDRTGTSLCVPQNTCLVFRINDTAGDGINHPSYGYGGYWLYLDGALVRAGGTFGSFEETSFNCAPGFSCATALPLTLAPVGTTFPVTLATFTTTAVEQWYDFTPPQTGSYAITTCNTNTCDTRLWVYDAACNTLVLTSGVEGATFADDNDGGCGLQAVVNANMPGGTLHRLRVGDNAGACGPAITVSIIYNGPVVGCMNIASCNYSPLATIPCTSCCIAFGSPNCPAGPDLTMHQGELQNSLVMQTVNITDPCAPVEGCTRALGQRRLLRFSTRIDNVGTTDYYIGNNSTFPGMFSTNNCHGHAHFQGYADYILFDQTGNAIPVGFKNGFCVIDVGCTTGTGQYGCSNMGISKGCYDRYSSGTTCNWIDVTDVAPGTYTLVLRTNWQRSPDALGRHEMSYSNNFAQVCINLTATSFSVVGTCPTYTDCLGQAYGDARVDCNGVCNGPTKRGDLTSDGNQTQPDAQQYVQRILGNDISATSCNDLNGDGLVTVTDAALVVNCYSQQTVHDQANHVLHYHPWCEYPRGFLSSLDTVTFSLANLDPVTQTVDVMIKNPSCRVLGFEFTLGGATIQSAVNLAPNLIGDVSMNTSLGGTKVIGLSYIDTSLVKNPDFVPLCRINYLTLNGPSVCIASVADVVNKDANNVISRIENGCLLVPNTVTVSPKIWLDGPYSEVDGLMRDDLRLASRIPSTEPYTALGFSHVGGGGEQVANSVLSVTGPNAIVDWVYVELRGANLPHPVLATRCALVQRDGDVVAVDGLSPVMLQLTPGTYHVTVRHRNHLGIMTATPIAIGSAPSTVDFRSSAAPVWGTNARKGIGAAMCMWAGNARVDRTLSYTGQDNDRDPILMVIGGIIPTNSVTGYYLEDTNLSGEVKYTGAANDRDLILQNIGGTIPTNSLLEQLPTP